MLTKLATLMALMAVSADARRGRGGRGGRGGGGGGGKRGCGWKPVDAGSDIDGTEGIDIVALSCTITSNDTAITDTSIVQPTFFVGIAGIEGEDQDWIVAWGKNLDDPVDATAGSYVDYTIDLTASGGSTAPGYTLFSTDADKDADRLSKNSRLPTTWDTRALTTAAETISVNITKAGVATFSGSCATMT